MSEMIFTQPSPETPASTGWENMDNQAQQLPEVDPAEPVAQPVFGTEAVPAAETPAVETTAVEAPTAETPATEAEPLTFPEGTANDAYGLEGRGNLGDEIAAEGEPNATETIAETTATPEANENKEAILQAIADIRNRLDAIEASL